jgi:streptomycin 6-kinase
VRDVPERLRWWRSRPGGAAWLERLPRLVEECAAAWDLHVREPFGGANVSFVAPAVLADGTQAVLKVNFPDAESEHEADALAAWGGKGAVRLLATDPERGALLVERAIPGTQLWAIADEEAAGRAAAGVLRALWRAPPDGHGFRALEGEARRWAQELPARFERHSRPFDRALLHRAVGWIGELLGSPDGPQVLVHQDLHGGNVLLAGPEGARPPSTAEPGPLPLWGKPGGPWLAIDPKPLVGERAFDVASLLRDRRPQLAADPAPVQRIRRRLDRLAEALDLDRERMRRWAVVHALAWGLAEDEWFPDIVACAGWLDEA